MDFDVFHLFVKIVKFFCHYCILPAFDSAKITFDLVALKVYVLTRAEFFLLIYARISD